MRLSLSLSVGFSNPPLPLPTGFVMSEEGQAIDELMWGDDAAAEKGLAMLKESTTISDVDIEALRRGAPVSKRRAAIVEIQKSRDLLVEKEKALPDIPSRWAKAIAGKDWKTAVALLSADTTGSIDAKVDSLSYPYETVTLAAAEAGDPQLKGCLMATATMRVVRKSARVSMKDAILREWRIGQISTRFGDVAGDVAVRMAYLNKRSLDSYDWADIRETTKRDGVRHAQFDEVRYGLFDPYS